MNVQKAIQLLRDRQYKVTNQRKDMIHYFYHENGYRSAKDVMNHMEHIHPSMSFDTVYRNLHLYHSLHILEATTLNGEKHYRMNCTAEHHHHFICNDCGSTTKLTICPMHEVYQMLTNYFIEDHKFEVYGICPECQTV